MPMVEHGEAHYAGGTHRDDRWAESFADSVPLPKRLPRSDGVTWRVPRGSPAQSCDFGWRDLPLKPSMEEDLRQEGSPRPRRLNITTLDAPEIDRPDSSSQESLRLVRPVLEEALAVDGTKETLRGPP